MQERNIPKAKSTIPAKPSLIGKKDIADEKALDQRWLNAKLREASEKDDQVDIENLIKAGADVNSKDSGGWTPLMFAAQSGHMGICNLLIEKGAKIDAREENGRNAIMIAYQAGYILAAQFIGIMNIVGIEKGQEFLYEFRSCIRQ
ncbi:MAG: ankyrin repeat domain-containing protein [Candidatus Micrarchaeota archaeon]|nr:ankyrin repeat domain-containing protein [Candidatus Micrarchaeota archaeon]